MSNDGVAAVERALSLLDCFGPATDKLTLAQLADRVPLHKTTIFRLMNSLVRCGYATKDKDGRYALGPRLLYLGRVYEHGFQLRELVMPVLESLSGATGESAAYYVEADEPGHRLCLFRHQPHEGLLTQVLAGSIMPPDESSTGRVFKIWSQLRAFSGEPLPFFSCGIRDPYTSSWSVPVVGQDDRFAGALTLAGPSERVRHANVPHIERLMMEHASRLSASLGASRDMRLAIFSPPPPR